MLKHPPRSARRKKESGFALLLIFAMAAGVAIMFYLEMPRVAFEHQRNKEGLLVERGEQYIRAIQLYRRKFQGKLPQKIDDLENTNNIRFLRKRYVDPLTNSEEWRLVHVDAAGQFVDSLVHKRPGQEEKKGPSVLAATIQGIGETAEYTPGLGGEQQANPALLKRASDRLIPGTPGAGGEGEAPPAGGQAGEEESRSGPAPKAEGPPDPLDYLRSLQQQQGQPGNPNAPVALQPGQQPQQSPAAGNAQQGQPPQLPGGSQPALPPEMQGGRPGQPNQGVPQQGGGAGSGGFGFGSGSGFGSTNRPTAPQAPASPFQSVQQGGAGQGAPNQALDAIRGMLSGNRQGPGGTGLPGGAQGSGTLGSGGIIGVASKAEMEGILVYNERTKVQEWEFLYDPKKEQEAQVAAQGAGQQAPLPGGQGQPGPGGQQGPLGQPATNTGSISAPRGGGAAARAGGGFGISPGAPAAGGGSSPSTGSSSGFGFGSGGGFGFGSGGGSSSGSGAGATPRPVQPGSGTKAPTNPTKGAGKQGRQ